MPGRYSRRAWLAIYGALAVGTLLMIFPLVWMLLVSLKTEPETFAYPMTWLPQAPTLRNYANVWLLKKFGRYFLNSSIVAGVTTLLAMAVAAPAAYGFSRFRYPFASTLQSFFLTTQMVPGILLVIPYFVMMRAAGLVNTYPSLFLIYTALALPFCTWMLIGFFHSIPREIDQAALVMSPRMSAMFCVLVFCEAWPTVKKIALLVNECTVMCNRPANAATGPPMPKAKVMMPMCSTDE